MGAVLPSVEDTVTNTYTFGIPPQPPQPPQGLHVAPIPPKKPSTAWKVVKWLAFFALAGICVVSVFANFILSAGIGGGTSRGDKATEKHVSGASSLTAKAKVAIVTVDDIIIGTEEAGPAAWIMQQLDRAKTDSEVQAVLLDVNSPGGGITASDIIHEKIREIQKTKKVIVLMRDVAASGAYYISASADRIIAHPTTITGSIGVIISSFNVEGLFQKIGVEHVVFKSGPHKDMLSPYRPITDEEKSKLQGITNDMFKRFKEVVASGRNLSSEEVDALSTGAIFTAQQALDGKLIDAIGYYGDALSAAIAATKHKSADVEVVKYEQPPTIASLLFGARSEAGGGIEAEMGRYIESHRPGFYFLWPGP
jgi:protease-4